MICIKCNENKGSDFRKNRQVCRECDNEMARQKTIELKQREKPESIICNICSLRKTEFRINRRKCLDCERSHGRKYRKETDKAKIWTDTNKEQMSKLQHNWYEKNKKEIRTKVAERYKHDDIFRKATDHRRTLTGMVRSTKNTTSKHINTNSNTIRDWLEFQFIKDMSFDNYGTYWVVDHVIPVHTYLSGKYSAELILNWFNICPVLKSRNLTKNKYVDSDQCLEHLENIREYTEIRGIKKDIDYCSVLERICL